MKIKDEDEEDGEEMKNAKWRMKNRTGHVEENVRRARSDAPCLRRTGLSKIEYENEYEDEEEEEDEEEGPSGAERPASFESSCCLT